MSTPSGNAHSEQQLTGRGSQPQESLSRFMYGSSAAQHRITTDEEPPTPTRMAVMGQLSKRHMADPQPSDETDTQSLHSVESMQGGRLWKLAGEAAKEQEQQQHRRFPGARLAETFIEKTRSRAVPDANMIHDHERKKILNGTVRMSGDIKSILMNTGPAHRRVRVVQLLVIGILGLFCWLGNFFVTTSCHFGTIHKAVGEYGNHFPVHYGLYKYSPIDSALGGFTYCYPYSSEEASAWLIIGRCLNAVALLCGTFSLVVLWLYLITGRAGSFYWHLAIRCGWVAAALQMGVNVCLVQFCQESCRMGPASWGTLLTGVAWGVMGLELGYLRPTEEEIGNGQHDASTIVTSLEMADWKVASQEYMERAFGGPKYSPPSISS